MPIVRHVLSVRTVHAAFTRPALTALRTHIGGGAHKHKHSERVLFVPSSSSYLLPARIANICAGESVTEVQATRHCRAILARRVILARLDK